MTDKPDYERAVDLCYYGWTVIANAGGGNWENETAEWRQAAERFRDRFHAELWPNVVERNAEAPLTPIEERKDERHSTNY
jgi:hypothetical protein